MEKYPHDHHNQSELQLLPTRHSFASTSSPTTTIHPSDSSSKSQSQSPDHHHPLSNLGPSGPSLDLQLSISLHPSDCVTIHPACADMARLERVEALRWHASEQIQLSEMEKDYVERVREMSRREIELAQLEFARAREVWDRARDEIEKVEEMKGRIDSGCVEITCQGCRQKFWV